MFETLPIGGSLSDATPKGLPLSNATAREGDLLMGLQNNDYRVVILPSAGQSLEPCFGPNETFSGSHVGIEGLYVFLLRSESSLTEAPGRQ